MSEQQTLMTFPCDFQIKIIGSNTKSFAKDIIKIAREHFPDITEASIQKKTSQNDNYLAISIMLHVKDQITLDALYMELTKHRDIKMVL